MHCVSNDFATLIANVAANVAAKHNQVTRYLHLFFSLLSYESVIQ